jgi:hypothetical protein
MPCGNAEQSICACQWLSVSVPTFEPVKLRVQGPGLTEYSFLKIFR